MAELFTLNNAFTLAMLVLLQAVLGFDNLLYISLESKKVAPEERKKVRRIGISLAIILRIALLFILTSLISYFQNPVFSANTYVVSGEFNIHSLIVVAGGAFIIYTAVKEISHLLIVHKVGDIVEKPKEASLQSVIFWIVLMNLVFSFDSILSAMALTKVFAVMATAIAIGGILMIWLADRVADFLEKNRMFEVLGLFVLFIVGIMLLSEGGHLAHLKFFGHEVTQMSKATFYFVIVVLLIVDIVQGRYQKRLLAEAARNSVAAKEG